MADKPLVLVEKINGHVTIITINRPEVKNCVDGPTAKALADAFRAFDADKDVSSSFVTGADLRALSTPNRNQVSLDHSHDGPMGPTRMHLSKPVIASVEGYAVAGGLELAVWCDLRVAAEDAVFGVFCRSKGVPLIDGGTIRLPRLVGQSFALDMILTGRPVSATEGFHHGLVNRLSPATTSTLSTSIELARQIASHPQVCLRNDRTSVYSGFGNSVEEALKIEVQLGMGSLASSELQDAVKSFFGEKKKGEVWGVENRTATGLKEMGSGKALGGTGKGMKL
ncbi:Enoyl-CoA hydratase [Gonapodya sp. JEL0774]|nr:Enoyl-CoA hydratase [Gonapodya sp. JEL0774]